MAAISPGKAEPSNILLNGVHILNILLRRIRIVKAQVAKTAVVFRDAEIETDGLCMPHMEIAVRLRRESCMDSRFVTAISKIFINDRSDKIRYFCCFRHSSSSPYDSSTSSSAHLRAM